MEIIVKYYKDPVIKQPVRAGTPQHLNRWKWPLSPRCQRQYFGKDQRLKGGTKRRWANEVADSIPRLLLLQSTQPPGQNCQRKRAKRFWCVVQEAVANKVTLRKGLTFQSYCGHGIGTITPTLGRGLDS